MIVVCGVPASGKSHLAIALAQLSGLPHLTSDATRKRLAGLNPTEHAPEQVYSAEWNVRTYAALAELAAQAAASGGGAIVDATFRHLADRQAFRSALRAAVPQLFVECCAPRTVLAERSAGRERDTRRISDADTALVMRELQSFQPLDEVPPDAHVTLRTDRAVEEIVGDLMALLDRRLLNIAVSGQ